MTENVQVAFVTEPKWVYRQPLTEVFPMETTLRSCKCSDGWNSRSAERMTLIGRLEGGSAIAGQRENKSICLFFLSNPQLRVKMFFKLHFKRAETKESPKMIWLPAKHHQQVWAGLSHCHTHRSFWCLVRAACRSNVWVQLACDIIGIAPCFH